MSQRIEFRLLVKGPEASWREIAIPPGVTNIGRQPGNELVLDDLLVSRRHAKITCSADQCEIMDLGSSNGTRLNDQLLTPNVQVQLTHQVSITIGPFEITFERNVTEVPEVISGAKSTSKPAPKSTTPRTAEDDRGVQEAQPASAAGVTSDLVSKVGFFEGLLDQEAGVEKPSENGKFPPGMSSESRKLINYLPGIYQSDPFMRRFLGIFESILLPIEWNIDSFDLYLDPVTAPGSFLPWLANWFDIVFDPTWSEDQKRSLLKEAHQIFARRGTRWALSRILEIYTGATPEIVDVGEKVEPYHFIVRLPLRLTETRRELVSRLIDAHKPAHTTYRLEAGK